MLERALFVYGPVRAKVEYAGRGKAPPWEKRKEKVNLWDITLSGPGGVRYLTRDWSPTDEDPDHHLLGSMVRSVIVELDSAYVNPGGFKKMHSHLPEAEIYEAVGAALQLGRHVRIAAKAALEHAERIGEGGDPAAFGPKEWFPGAD